MKEILYICSVILVSFLFTNCNDNTKRLNNSDTPTVTVMNNITLTCTKQNIKTISAFKITKKKEKYYCTNHITNGTETNTELLSHVADNQEACLQKLNLYQQILKAIGYICTSTENISKSSSE